MLVGTWVTVACGRLQGTGPSVGWTWGSGACRVLWVSSTQMGMAAGPEALVGYGAVGGTLCGPIGQSQG